MVWQIDPYKCIACGNCATHCVLEDSAVKCMHVHAICGYCRICFGFFDPEPFELTEGAENQICPTGAIERKLGKVETALDKAIEKQEIPGAVVLARMPREDEVLEYVVAFLSAAHAADLRYSVRDGLNVARYAMKVLTRGEAGGPSDAVAVALRLAIGDDEAAPFAELFC